MATLPPEPAISACPPFAGAADPDQALALWDKVAGQARRLTALARIGADEDADAALGAMIAKAGSQQRALAMQGLEDIAAMLDIGIAALDTLAVRGQDGAAPALALWIEYHAARSAIAAMLGSVRN